MLTVDFASQKSKIQIQRNTKNVACVMGLFAIYATTKMQKMSAVVENSLSFVISMVVAIDGKKNLWTNAILVYLKFVITTNVNVENKYKFFVKTLDFFVKNLDFWYFCNNKY